MTQMAKLEMKNTQSQIQVVRQMRTRVRQKQRLRTPKTVIKVKTKAMRDAMMKAKM